MWGSYEAAETEKGLIVIRNLGNAAIVHGDKDFVFQVR